MVNKFVGRRDYPILNQKYRLQIGTVILAAFPPFASRMGTAGVAAFETYTAISGMTGCGRLCSLPASTTGGLQSTTKGK